jgi:hypothetical protein
MSVSMTMAKTRTEAMTKAAVTTGIDLTGPPAEGGLVALERFPSRARWAWVLLLGTGGRGVLQRPPGATANWTTMQVKMSR